MATDASIDWSVLASRGGLTIDDLPEEDPPGVRMELVSGSLYVTPLGDLEHQRLVAEYASLLLQQPLEAGWLVLAGVNVIVSDDLLVIPDVAVVDPAYSVRNGLGVSPAGVRLAIEVTSPSTRLADVTVKRELYRSWGVPYVVVDRAKGTPVLDVEGELPEFAAVLLEG